MDEQDRSLPPLAWSPGDPVHPNSGWEWIASRVNSLANTPEGVAERLLVDNRDRIEFVGGIEDEDASYSFDDTALIKLDTTYYLVGAAGCSCPSHEETWGVEAQGSLSDICKELIDGNYKGYTYRHGELVRLFEFIGAEVGRIAP